MINLNIKAAIKAHYINYLLSHFNLTRWSKNIRKLYNKYESKRCFIIGNGPSLTVSDLEKLTDEYSFAFNRIYYIFDKTNWRPTFYCTQDVKIAKSSEQEINDNISAEYLFAPINFKLFENININSKYYFNAKYSGFEIPDFSNDISSYIGCGNTVACTAIQIAIYLGFNEIILLGVDHNFKKYQDENGNIVIDQSAKDYFCDEYNKNNTNAYIPRLDLSTACYIKAKQFADMNNVKIYNATRGGKLEVFPRVDFDTLF